MPSGKTRICIAGFKISHHTGKAHKMAAMIAEKFPDRFESWYYWAWSGQYNDFLKETFDPVPFPPHLKGHGSSPFVWLEHSDGSGVTNTITPIGGREHFVEWIKKEFTGHTQEETAIVEFAAVAPSLCGDASHMGDAPMTCRVVPSTAPK